MRVQFKTVIIAEHVVKDINDIKYPEWLKKKETWKIFVKIVRKHYKEIPELIRVGKFTRTAFFLEKYRKWGEVYAISVGQEKILYNTLTRMWAFENSQNFLGRKNK